jgi:hypothetical protein
VRTSAPFFAEGFALIQVENCSPGCLRALSVRVKHGPKDGIGRFLRGERNLLMCS